MLSINKSNETYTIEFEWRDSAPITRKRCIELLKNKLKSENYTPNTSVTEFNIYCTLDKTLNHIENLSLCFFNFYNRKTLEVKDLSGEK